MCLRPTKMVAPLPWKQPVRGLKDISRSSFNALRLMILALFIFFCGLRVYPFYQIPWKTFVLWRANRADKRCEAQPRRSLLKKILDSIKSRWTNSPSESHGVLTSTRDPEVPVIDEITIEDEDGNKLAVEEEEILARQDTSIVTSTLLSTGSSSPDEPWGSIMSEADTTMTTPDAGSNGSSTIQGDKPCLYPRLHWGGGDLIQFKGIHDIYIHVGHSTYPRRCLFDSGSDVNVMSQDCQVELGLVLDPLDPSDNYEILLPGKKMEILGKVKHVNWHHDGGARTYTTEWFVVDTDQFDAVYGNPDMEKEKMLYMLRR